MLLLEMMSVKGGLGNSRTLATQGTSKWPIPSARMSPEELQYESIHFVVLVMEA
jgi:hypothetical protein